MGLGEYNRKRDFRVTAEPPGREGGSATGSSFVVQKHAARRLHYDFRLELDGVLKSWSIPKGPSFDPSVKRLAVMTEDHPIDYGGFEGVIPAGQYGGGTVLLWDRGTWAPVGDAAAGLAAGHLKFDLVGHKLRGRWALVRLDGRRRARAKDGGSHGGQGPDDRSWLLVKDRDAHARPEAEWNVVDARPESVTSGRDLDAVATASDRVWHSDRGHRPDAAGVPGARKAKLPARVARARAARARAVPDGDGWLHEVELAGTPVRARIASGSASLTGQDDRELGGSLPGLLHALQALPANDAILDGIATAIGPGGGSRDDAAPDTLYLTDVLYLDGHDLRAARLEDRKALLAALVAASGPAPGLRYADHVTGRGPEAFAAACGLGARGLVSKQADSRYPASGKPARAWRVVRCEAAAPSRGAAARTSPGPSLPPAPARAPAAPARAPLPGEIYVAGVRLTHPERMLYPAAGITKLDLARFYERIGPSMLPHLRDRPLTLVRAPDGVGGHRFYVRHAGDWAPRELRQFEIEDGTGSGTTMIADDLAGLVALAQMNVLEIHPWNARTAQLEMPDRMVFDLDPGPELAWDAMVEGARQVRAVLELFGLTSFVKTTGSKGLHVVVPLDPAAGWAATLGFSRAIAQAIAKAEPGRFSAGLAKSGRENKIFVDYLRNRRGATSVSVFSTRARDQASVSVPIAWDALGPGTRSDSFRVGDTEAIMRRLDPDPWADYFHVRQRLTDEQVQRAEGLAAAAGK